MKVKWSNDARTGRFGLFEISRFEDPVLRFNSIKITSRLLSVFHIEIHTHPSPSIPSLTREHTHDLPVSPDAAQTAGDRVKPAAPAPAPPLSSPPCMPGG